MRRATLATTPDVPELEQLLRQVVAEQVRQGEQLAAILRLLERNRGARDAADAQVVAAIKEVLRDRTFTSAHVLALADTDVPLREALAAADVTNARELGHLLRRLEGVAIRGLTIKRAPGDYRGGVLWRCELCEL